MPGGKITKCPNTDCGRLVIYGQTCTCGINTSHPAATPSCRSPRKGKNKR